MTVHVGSSMRSGAAPGCHEERIVVVSADQSVLTLFRETLDRKGYEVTYLTNGRDAVDHVQNEVVDALFMDLFLPDLSWRDLLIHVKDRLPNTPTVVTADPARMREAIAALHAGAFDYLLQPFRPEELEGVLLRALRERNKREETLGVGLVAAPFCDEERGDWKLDQTVRDLSLLLRVSQLFATTDDFSSLTSYFVETVADGLSAERVSLLLLTADGTALEVAAAHGLPRDGLGAKVPVGEWIAGRVLQEAIPMRVRNIATELHRPSRRGYRTGAFLAVPLYAGAQPIGVLALSDPIDRASFTEEEMRLTLSIARMAANAIAARRQLGQIRHLEGFVRDLLEHLPGGVMTVDLAGRVSYLNPRGEKILGLKVVEALGRSYIEVLKPALEPSALLAALTSVGPLEHQEVSVVGPIGVPVTLDLSTSVWTNGEGERQGIVIAFSELRRFPELPEKARRSQNLATLGELAAGLAHEVRNPLAGMLTGAQLIARRLGEDDPCREYANLILEEGQRLEDLLRSLLDFARPSRTNFTESSLSEILDRALSLIKPLIQAQKIQVRRHYASTVGEILADRQGLLQVFLNLMLNAVQAMPHGGTLYVLTMPDGDGVRVEIKDTGEGIPPDRVARIFDPFFTTKPEGTGLGLTLSLKIISEHGGKVTVNSEPGAGTSFVIHLAASPEGSAVRGSD